jgi:hypothetical protein
LAAVRQQAIDRQVLAVSLIGPRNQVAKLVRHLELPP